MMWSWLGAAAAWRLSGRWHALQTNSFSSCAAPSSPSSLSPSPLPSDPLLIVLPPEMPANILSSLPRSNSLRSSVGLKQSLMRSPLIHSLSQVSAFFGGMKLNTEINPDTAIAIGAARSFGC